MLNIGLVFACAGAIDSEDHFVYTRITSLCPYSLGKLRKAGFDAEVVACRTPWFEPSTEDRPKSVVLALAGIEIQPKARIGISIASTVSVDVNLLKECIRCLYQLVGIEGGKWKSQTADSTVMAWII